MKKKDALEMLNVVKDTEIEAYNGTINVATLSRIIANMADVVIALVNDEMHDDK